MQTEQDSISTITREIGRALGYLPDGIPAQFNDNPGEQCFIDYAGMTVPVTDPGTGERATLNY